MTFDEYYRMLDTSQWAGSEVDHRVRAEHKFTTLNKMAAQPFYSSLDSDRVVATLKRDASASENSNSKADLLVLIEILERKQQSSKD
jgi:hypothetical protein